MRLELLSSLVFVLILAAAAPAAAHDTRNAMGGRQLLIDTEGDPARSRFVFVSDKDPDIRLGHVPNQEPTSLLVRTTGDAPLSTGLIPLDPAFWSPIETAAGETLGWRYYDPQGNRAGIKRMTFRQGKFTIIANGPNWPLEPVGAQDSVEIFFGMEEEWFCAVFDPTTAVTAHNQTDKVQMRNAPPAGCAAQVCGNGVQELGEECDDGDLEDGDSCSNSCTINTCPEVDYATTYEAIQDIIFDSPVYDCTNDACHGAAALANLDLRADTSFDALVNVDAFLDANRKRVLAPEPDESLLYLKLLAKTEGIPAPIGGPMPAGAPPALTEDHLQAVYEWIRGGAPGDRVVAGTADLLGTCMPAPTALNIPVPAPPDPGEGVQLQSTAWPLPGPGEDEICQPIYYDFYGTGLVPEDAIVDCPDRYAYENECPEGDASCVARNGLNPEGKCFAIKRQLAQQDPQSHHLILFMYGGGYEPTYERWGDWTYKLQDTSHPDAGQPCDPYAIDPTVGYNPGCSGETKSNVACISYGPPDFGDIANFGGEGSVLVSQEAYYDLKYPPGVYEVLPMRGVFVWNVHAFNLTQTDTTMSSYLNLEFAKEAERTSVVREVLDVEDIFTQYVPPFETREYCSSYTLPKGGRMFRLSSHMHKRGTLFRIWGPPNTPCRAECDADNPLCPILTFLGDPALPICEGPGPVGQEMYYNTSYSDALNIIYDPPLEFDHEDPKDRTFLYCAVYDNHSTPFSPDLKRRSKAPPAAPPFGLIFGGSCNLDGVMRCANEGPMKGQLCGAVDAVCDSTFGAGDGDCDACPVSGGVTSDDEMLALFVTWYCSEGEGEDDCKPDSSEALRGLPEPEE